MSDQGKNKKYLNSHYITVFFKPWLKFQTKNKNFLFSNLPARQAPTGN
jgi:hypothetical protein